MKPMTNKKMYNEKIKEAFIVYKLEQDTVLPSRYYIDNMFYRTGKWEERLGKDLYEWNTTEILNFYKSLYWKSEQKIMNMNSMFTQYYRYCRDRGFIDDIINPFEDAYPLLWTCVNKAAQMYSIYSEEKIQDFLRNPMIENEYMRFAILALFEGICGKECCEITQATILDIDQEKCIFHTCTGREVEISKQLIGLAIESDRQETYTTAKGTQRRLVPSGYIINPKNVRVDPANVKTRFVALEKEFTWTAALLEENFFTTKGIYLSGVINFCKKRIAELGISFFEYIYNNDYNALQEIYDARGYAINTKKTFFETYKVNVEG